MKILQITDTFLPIHGGAEMHVYYLSKQLLELGHEVEIVTGTKAKSEVEQFPCPIHRLNIGTSRREFPKLILAIPRLMKRARQFDVLHVHYSYQFAFIIALIGWLLRKPVVVTLHGMGTLDSSVETSWFRGLYRYISIKFAHRVIATSPEMRDIALRYTGTLKIEDIVNGVDLDFFTQDSEREFSGVADYLRIGTLRRMVPKNGVHYAVDSLVRGADRLKFEGYLIGDGPQYKSIQKTIKNAGLENSIHMLGVQGHEMIKKRIESIDVLCFLSTAESFSLAALECMAMGCIVLTSNAGAYPKLIKDGENGFMIELFESGKSNYNAAESLSDLEYERVIEKLEEIQRTPPEILLKISKEARNTVETSFGWSAIAKETVARCYSKY